MTDMVALKADANHWLDCAAKGVACRRCDAFVDQFKVLYFTPDELRLVARRLTGRPI